jgi:class 3 adenylate cyclase
MTAVERFIEINSWTPARKTLAISAVALPGFLFNWLAMRLALVPGALAHIGMLDAIFGTSTLLMLVCLAASALARRHGATGSWPAYVFITFYGTMLLVFMYSVGIWSTPVFAVFAIATLVTSLYFGRRIALHAVLLGVVEVVLVGALQGADLLPYAPMLLARSLDAQTSGRWIAVVMVPTATTFAIGFLLAYLIVAARDLQDRRLQQAQRLIGRYVPGQLAARILSGEHGDDLKPERRKLTIFFSDLEGFTEASDQLDPEELAAVLNEYLSEMATIADAHGATLNQFVGDGIMIFFGAPQATDDADHARRAVRMALAMQRRMAQLHAVWLARGIQAPFRARIGINTGHASVGDFGSAGRKVYSAIGVQTNLAARIQAHCEPGRVLISHSTWGLVHEDFSCVERGEMQFKGLHYVVQVYEVVAEA